MHWLVHERIDRGLRERAAKRACEVEEDEEEGEEGEEGEAAEDGEPASKRARPRELPRSRTGLRDFE